MWYYAKKRRNTIPMRQGGQLSTRMENLLPNRAYLTTDQQVIMGDLLYGSLSVYVCWLCLCISISTSVCYNIFCFNTLIDLRGICLQHIKWLLFMHDCLEMSIILNVVIFYHSQWIKCTVSILLLKLMPKYACNLITK